MVQPTIHPRIVGAPTIAEATGFFGDSDKPDPAPIPSVWVAVVKGIFFLLAILGLVGSLREKKQRF